MLPEWLLSRELRFSLPQIENGGTEAAVIA